MYQRFSASSWVCSTAMLWTLTLALLGCGNRDPFAYVQVRGKVSYEDGTLIPAKRLALTFISQTPPTDRKTHAPPGRVEVDVATGAFTVVSSHTYGDGLVRGDHKVLVHAEGNGILVPPEYEDPAKTPLTANSDGSPFDFKIRKPAGRK